MRYKDQVLNKINQLENLNRTLDFQLSRGEGFNELMQTLSDMKEKMDAIKDFIPADDKALYDSLIEKLTPPPPPLAPIDLSTIKSMLISLNQILL